MTKKIEPLSSFETGKLASEHLADYYREQFEEKVIEKLKTQRGEQDQEMH